MDLLNIFNIITNTYYNIKISIEPFGTTLLTQLRLNVGDMQYNNNNINVYCRLAVHI